MSTAHAAILAFALALMATVAAAADEPPASSSDARHGPAGAPVPEAWDYVRLSPEERYALRERARSLPEDERREHNRALRKEIDKLPAWIYEALHDERLEMDCQHGSVAPLPKPPQLDAWAYARLVPHQRYEFRLRARALAPQERAAYEAHLAAELAKLPQWLQAALAEEAGRADLRYGLAQCPERSRG
jgi:hypothetical protein